MANDNKFEALVGHLATCSECTDDVFCPVGAGLSDALIGLFGAAVQSIPVPRQEFDV
jgi:hypothetical protein